MAVKHNNVLLNLITGCLYWLTTCFGQLHDHHQVYKSQRIDTHTMQRIISMERNGIPLCLTTIQTNSNHQHNGMEGTKNRSLMSFLLAMALYIVCFVSLCVLFVCKCVLYYCLRVSTQLQLTNISYIMNVSFFLVPSIPLC